MTARARLVLDAARAALEMHGRTRGGPVIRATWFAVVGLIRAVGHVLAKVDAATDKPLADAVNQCWRELNATKPEPAIFWGFIEGERNRFLKNYEHGITRIQIIRTGSRHSVMALDLANAQKGTQLISAFNIPPEIPDRSIISVLSDGPFEGSPETVIAARAIEWWEQYISSVEALRNRNAEA